MKKAEEKEKSWWQDEEEENLKAIVRYINRRELRTECEWELSNKSKYMYYLHSSPNKKLNQEMNRRNFGKNWQMHTQDWMGRYITCRGNFSIEDCEIN